MSVDTIANSGGAGALYDTQQVSGTTAKNKTSKSETVVPSASTRSTSSSSSTDNDIPNLEAPTTSSLGYSGLSLESLVDAIGNTESKQACAEGVDRMERQGEKINENNQLKLEEMADNLDTLRKQRALGPFMEAFEWIGAILGAVASITSFVVGVMTVNPLMIAGGILGVGLAVDSMASIATDGEKSMMKGIQKGLEKAGMSEEGAYWFAFAVNLTYTALTVGCSIGGAVKGVKAAADVASQAMRATHYVQAGMDGLSSLNTVASGSASIANSTYEYQLSMSQAEQIDIEAVLEQIRMARDFEQAMLEAEMQRSNDLLKSVNDIIKESNSTAQAIMTHAPSMA